MEREAVKVSIANLRSFPCIRSKERNGELKLVGAVFAISDGILNILNENTGRFDPA
jgi:carbonic anhydrase